MVKNLIKIYFVISVFFMGFAAYASSEDKINTPNSIPAPRTSYLLSYTMNAESASLIQENNSEFKLILQNPHENIGRTVTALNKKSDLINTTDFINRWKKRKNINVQTDLTGVQVNNKVFGHTQFYATVFLKNPIYRGNELVFELISIKPLIKMQNRRSDLKNVTLYVNGCDLFDCKNLNKAPQAGTVEVSLCNTQGC